MSLKYFSNAYQRVFQQSFSIKYFQMDHEIEPDIIELCDFINEKCEISKNDFSIQVLKQPSWYLEVLSTICPYLEEEIKQIHSVGEPSRAIQEILRVINELDEFHENVMEIVNSELVTMGNVEHIQYMVQIFHNLLQSAINQDSSEQSEPPQHHTQPEQRQYQSASGRDEIEKLQQIDPEPTNEIIPPLHSQKQQIINNFHEDDMAVQSSQQQSLEQQVERQDFSPMLPPIAKEIRPQATSEENEISPHFLKNPKALNQYQIPNHQNKVKKNGKIKQEETHRKKRMTDKEKHKTKNKKRSTESFSGMNNLKKGKSSAELKLVVKHPDKQKDSKKMKKNMSVGRLKSPEKRKLDQISTQMKKINREKRSGKFLTQRKNQNKLKNILKWKDERIKKQKKFYEFEIKNKIQFKKEQYIQKVNDLLLKLQKQKEIEDEKEFKETILRENHQAVKKMINLQRWYYDQINKLKKNKKNPKKTITTGHKDILGQLRKQLKNQNEKKLISLTQQYREQESNILEELDQLSKKIMKVYKSQ